MNTSRPYRVAATGEAFSMSGAHTMIGARLAAGAAAAAIAIFRETDGSGAVLAELQCAQGETDECSIPVAFTAKIHVTLTGAGASAIAYV